MRPTIPLSHAPENNLHKVLHEYKSPNSCLLLLLLLYFILDYVGRLVFSHHHHLTFGPSEKAITTTLNVSQLVTPLRDITLFPITVSLFLLHWHIKVHLSGLLSEYTSLHHCQALPCDLLWPRKWEQDCHRPRSSRCLALSFVFLTPQQKSPKWLSQLTGSPWAWVSERDEGIHPSAHHSWYTWHMPIAAVQYNLRIIH